MIPLDHDIFQNLTFGCVDRRWFYIKSYIKVENNFDDEPPSDSDASACLDYVKMNNLPLLGRSMYSILTKDDVCTTPPNLFTGSNG